MKDYLHINRFINSKIAKVRKEFPTLRQNFQNKKLVYFDNACSVLKPSSVIKAISDYYTYLGTCGSNRSNHLLSCRVDDLIEESRNTAKEFINANSSKEMIWVKNSTEGINLIAACFPFTNKRNEVLLTTLEHHSNLLPFYEQSKKRNFKIKIVKVNQTGEFDLGQFKKAVSNKTALVAITHISNVTGLINPIDKISSIAHHFGAKILVDDAQYIANSKEDVQKNDIDFLVFSGHKIAGPTGIGVLYAKEQILKKLAPYNVGGGVVKSVSIKNDAINVKYLSYGLRFEAGVQNYASIIGLNSAMRFLTKLQRWMDINLYTQDLCNYAFTQLQNIDEVKFLADYKKLKPNSLISFAFKNSRISLYDFNLFLNSGLNGYFVAVRCGHHCAQPLHKALNAPISMRLSFFAYNTKKEIDIFVNALKQFLKK